MTQSADRKLMTNEEWAALSPESRHYISIYVMKLEAFWKWSRLIDKEHFEDDYYGRSENAREPSCDPK